MDLVLPLIQRSQPEFDNPNLWISNTFNHNENFEISHACSSLFLSPLVCISLSSLLHNKLLLLSLFLWATSSLSLSTLLFLFNLSISLFLLNLNQQRLWVTFDFLWVCLGFIWFVYGFYLAFVWFVCRFCLIVFFVICLWGCLYFLFLFSFVVLKWKLHVWSNASMNCLWVMNVVILLCYVQRVVAGATQFTWLWWMFIFGSSLKPCCHSCLWH